ncbi:uncharacterized protein LOC120293867 [Eucalyptus grandis]|uniref:uncharacterized protein LOC120293867 n=1 Tax=Eucalyptus grandis TaxID=71139 RepID=UPI00192EB05B|nr:uncharacterized protein LOC120293867 [Eucalyptus grandis]
MAPTFGAPAKAGRRCGTATSKVAQRCWPERMRRRRQRERRQLLRASDGGAVVVQQRQRRGFAGRKGAAAATIGAGRAAEAAQAAGAGVGHWRRGSEAQQQRRAGRGAGADGAPATVKQQLELQGAGRWAEEGGAGNGSRPGRKGEIFFYRPKVERDAAHGADDVQRLYIVLRPESGERPDLLLLAEEYDTSTRGHRHTAAARALGEGVYRILRHKSKGKKAHTHLIYKLEFPPEDEKQEPQESLTVEREGSFLIQIKNPDQHGAGPSQLRGLQSKRKAVFPAHLQGQFGQLRYSLADPPYFLNYEGCELLLISASDDIEEELGLELKAEGEADPSCSDLLETFGEIAPVDALLRGTWV